MKNVSCVLIALESGSLTLPLTGNWLVDSVPPMLTFLNVAVVMLEMLGGGVW